MAKNEPVVVAGKGIEASRLGRLTAINPKQRKFGKALELSQSGHTLRLTPANAQNLKPALMNFHEILLIEE